MRNYYILLFIFILIVLIYIKYCDLYHYSRDIIYIYNTSNDDMVTLLTNNNQLTKPNNDMNKILFVTFDNRNDEYIKIHNMNLEKYADNWNYEYKFIKKCNYNTYWCKIHIVLDELRTNKYDYVMWLDSDSIIKKLDIDIGKIFNLYNSDIYIGDDNNGGTFITNAGVFAIKNTTIGKQYLIDCIKNFDKTCLNSDNTLKGKWAGMCYEQGVMNYLISTKYRKYTTILPQNIISNGRICKENVFIQHLYASSSENRLKCFKKIKNL